MVDIHVRKYPKLAAKWRGIILESEAALESDEDPVFNRFIKSKLLSVRRTDGDRHELTYLDLRNNAEESNWAYLTPTGKRAVIRAIEEGKPVLLAEGLMSYDDDPTPFLLGCFALNAEREEFLENEPNLYRSDLERTDYENMTDLQLEILGLAEGEEERLFE